MLENLPKDFNRGLIATLGARHRRSACTIRVSKSDFTYMKARKFCGYFALVKDKFNNSVPREQVVENALKTGEAVKIVCPVSKTFVCVKVKKGFIDGNYVVVEIEELK